MRLSKSMKPPLGSREVMADAPNAAAPIRGTEAHGKEIPVSRKPSRSEAIPAVAARARATQAAPSVPWRGTTIA